MNTLDGVLFRSMITNGGLGLERHCTEVNDLNVFPVPDGDTGTNMVATMNGGIHAMSEYEAGVSLEEIAEAMRKGMLMCARGNSGVILSQFFAGLCEGLKGLKTASPAEYSAAMKEGVRRAYEVVIKPVEGTILTVMREGCEFADSSISQHSSFEDYFIFLQQKIKESLQNTPELLPVLKEAGVIDSGGQGFVYIIEGMAEALTGKISADVPTGTHNNNTKPIDIHAYSVDTKLDYGYCTEFILQLTNQKGGPENFDLQECIKFLETLGDSIVAFRDDNIVKVHVHTKTPDKAIAYALEYGDFLTFKMENMTLQHAEVVSQRQQAPVAQPAPTKQHSKVSVVAVAPTPEIARLFYEYNVPVVIESTELMNPDANEFINAFNLANADNIIVLPNNKNELMVAHQAAKLYTQSWIYVLETKDIMKGIAAASILDLVDLSLEDNLSRMEAAMKRAKTVGVARASHAYRKGNLKAKQGDYIGILDGTIVAAGDDLVSVFQKTLQNIPEIENTSCVTLFTGVNMEASSIEGLKGVIEEIDPFIETVIMEGGQRLYDLWANIE